MLALASQSRVQDPISGAAPWQTSTAPDVDGDWRSFARDLETLIKPSLEWLLCRPAVLLVGGIVATSIIILIHVQANVASLQGGVRETLLRQNRDLSLIVQ